MPQYSCQTAESSATKATNLYWSSNEDIQLCRSWLAVSKDPVKGVNVKGGQFFVHVKEHFDLHRGYTGTERSVAAIRKHWQGRISKRIMTYQDVVEKVKRLDASTGNDIARRDQVLELYRESFPKDTNFKYAQCLNELDREEKWIAFTDEQKLKESDRRAISPSSPTPVPDAVMEVKESGRSIRKKRDKSAKRKQKEIMKAFKKYLHVEQAKIKLMQHSIYMEALDVDWRLINGNPLKRRYYQALHKEIAEFYPEVENEDEQDELSEDQESPSCCRMVKSECDEHEESLR